CDRVGIIREGRLVAVENIGELKAKAMRTIDLHFAGPVPPAAFEGLPGVRDVQAEGDRVRCTVVGHIDALVKAAARFEVIDLVSHQPTLEEIFLAFYGKGETDVE
ncbi:MAG TPA: ABC transporter ATP-binding protein, partial [Actinomycetota bacterium]|nr:ABC transporter ATP-binding protein [Actinomycetota bacterium]